MSNKKISYRESKYRNSNPFIVGSVFSILFWVLLLIFTRVNDDFVLLYDPTSPIPHGIGIILGNFLTWLPVIIGIIFLLIGIANDKKIREKQTSSIILFGLIFVIVYYFLSLLVLNIFIHY